MNVFKSFLILFILISVMPTNAHACKCAGLNPKEAYQKADIVLIGTQTSEGGITSKKMLQEGNDSTPVTFAVSEIVKGALVNKEITVQRALDHNAMCQGFLVKQKEAFLIFLVKAGDGYKFMSDCYSASFMVENNSVFYDKVPVANLKRFLSENAEQSNPPKP